MHQETGASDVGGNLGGGEGLCTVSWRRGDKLGGGGGLVQAKREGGTKRGDKLGGGRGGSLFKPEGRDEV